MDTVKDTKMQLATDAVIKELKRAAEHPSKEPVIIGASCLSAVLTRLKAAEKERESWKGLAQQFGNELDTVRAKVAEMEKQEPVGIAGAMPGTSGFTVACFSADEVPVGTKLYALPGAQPAPKPEGE